MAFMPHPLWRSSCGFTTQESRPGYGHGAPLEGPVGNLPQSPAFGSLGRPDRSLWSLSTRSDHLPRRVTPILAVYATATVVVTVAAGTRCAWYGLPGTLDAEQLPPGPGT